MKGSAPGTLDNKTVDALQIMNNRSCEKKQAQKGVHTQTHSRKGRGKWKGAYLRMHAFVTILHLSLFSMRVTDKLTG
jgi:hypothetical protein